MLDEITFFKFLFFLFLDSDWVRLPEAVQAGLELRLAEGGQGPRHKVPGQQLRLAETAYPNALMFQLCI